MTPQDYLDQIQATRAKNNVNWMDLVRLAYEVAPDQAAAIFQKISDADSECLRLSQEVAKAHNKIVALRTKIL